MRRLLLSTLTLLALGATPSLRAALIAEMEIDGAAVNNTLGTAQHIGAVDFTIPVAGTVFNPPGYATATVAGRNGFDDVDFFGFTAYGGNVYLDMDNADPQFDPLIALFDGAGTLLAWNDDSDLDDGSVNTVDSFLGVFTLPGAGTYYVAVTESPNFPTTALTALETALTRPDGALGGYAVSGVTPGVSTYDFNGVQSGAAYSLSISLQNPVPEPGSMFLLGAGMVAIGFVARRSRLPRV